MSVAVMAQQGDDLLVTSRVGRLPEMKTLGASWDARQGAWRLAAARMNVMAAIDLFGGDVEIDPSVVAHLDPAPGEVDDDRLYDFQRRAVRALVDAPRGQLLCASPGLGKTAMAVVGADMLVPDDQVVVIAPASLLKNWEREICQWSTLDRSIAIIHGGEPDWEVVRQCRWLITSWDMLALHQDWLMGPWPLWILDESVLAKSRRSTRSLAVRGGTRKGKTKVQNGALVKTPDKKWANLRAGVERVWLLSGSPTTRFADDLWAQLNMIWPRAFRSYWRFAERYCVIEPNQWTPGPGTVVGTRRDRDSVADNADLIQVINQEDVLDLPHYLPEAVDLSLTKRQAAAYETMLRDFVAQLDSGREVVAENKISQLNALQRIVSYFDGHSSKHDALIELIAAGAYEPPFLIWTHWLEGAASLAQRLDKVMPTQHVSGKMTARAKDANIEGFKRGDLQALVLSAGVGKFGHTLVNARTIVYVDKTWNGDDYFQSLRRVRRIGLTHRPVLVTLRCPGTTDELLEMNLEGKMESIASITSANLRELILGLGRDYRA